MGIDVSYRRITPEQLDEAIADCEVANGLAAAPARDEYDKAPADARMLFIGKTWDAIRYLLELADGPTGMVDGEPTRAEVAESMYRLDGEQVRRVAGWLAAVSFDELIGSADPSDPDRRHIYKIDLDCPGDVTSVRVCYESLALFFAAAARHGDAMLIIHG